MKKHLSLLFVLMLALVVVVTACGGGGGETTDAAAKAGKELFAQSVIGSQAGCSTCHSLEANVIIVGPSLAGIASRAGKTVSGESAEEYLRESILKPDAHLVEGFPAGTMPQVWGEVLTSEQVNDLIAYLMTLK
ncbi:MAG: c-type cytochrome [Anaerolineales bacterium]|jgi:mono/diheme cytochrome c family protein